jgi:hypothetical protein
MELVIRVIALIQCIVSVQVLGAVLSQKRNMHGVYFLIPFVTSYSLVLAKKRDLKLLLLWN